MKYLIVLALIVMALAFLRRRRAAPDTSRSRPAPVPSPARAARPPGASPARIQAAAERPFGEDITDPDARVLPSPLLGHWAMPASGSGDFLVLEADTIVSPAGHERVVAVRFIDDVPDLATTHNVAVVSRGADDQYVLHYFGLAVDDSLVDLESADVVRRRL